MPEQEHFSVDGESPDQLDNPVEQSFPLKEFTAQELETPLSYQEVMPQLEQLINEAKNPVLVTDLDGTIVPFNPNPKDCQVHPAAKEALRRLDEQDIPIVVMTGRAGGEGARLIDLPRAIVVGTAGWEVYVRDPSNPEGGKSFIHEKFHPHQETITELLKTVRQEFFRDIIAAQGEEITTAELTSEIMSSEGEIVFERKAVNEEFPEGLAMTINFNQINPERWEEYLQFIDNLYQQIVPEELQELYKLDLHRGYEADPPTCGISISPYGQEGKEKSLIQIMRSDQDVNPNTGQPKRKEYFRGLPGGFDGVLYFGDSGPDAKALRAAHLSALMAGKKSAGVVVAGPYLSPTDKVVRYSDVRTEGIEQNAQLLTQLADTAEKRQKS